MAPLARRVRSARALATGLVAGLLALAAAASDPGTLVRYSFDDENVETGPDTFTVFAQAKGRVALATTYRVSGWHSVEIEDVAGDGDFPELAGSFDPRREGTLYVHFALLLLNPDETLNTALAGPGHFALAEDGIAFWLATRRGFLVHVSDGIPKRLFRPRAFTWYRVDLAYDVGRGRYDLQVAEEGRAEPVVLLSDQRNATSQPGAAVDRFSFIGDAGSDASNVRYFVDDIVIGTDRAVVQAPFVAPGRRRLFFDAVLAEQRRLRAGPRCPTPTDPTDVGFDARTVRDLGDVAVLAQAWRGELGAANAGFAENALVRGLELFAEGCRALEQGDAERAVALLHEAAVASPRGRLYPLAHALALAAAGREREAAARWQELSGPWTRDARYPAWAARFARARGDSRALEDWLERAADGARNAALVPPDLATAAGEHYFVLLDRERYAEAERLALALAERAERQDGARSTWLERAADCAVFVDDLERAVRRYEQALAQTPDRASLLLKLSDLAHVRGELDAERRYREQVYGTLRPGRR